MMLEVETSEQPLGGDEDTHPARPVNGAHEALRPARDDLRSTLQRIGRCHD